MIVEDCR